MNRTGTTLRLFLISLTLLVFPRPSAQAEHGSSSLRPRIPSREITQGVTSSELPGLMAFVSTLGVVPPIALDHVTPLAGDTPAEIERWEREVDAWMERMDQQALLLEKLGKAAKQTPGPLDGEFAKGLRELQRHLARQAQKVRNVRNRQGGLKEAGIDDLGGYLVSPQARKINEEILELFLRYSEALIEVSLEDPNASDLEKMTRAHRLLRERVPEKELTRYTGRDLRGLSTHHRDQITDLIRLRDHLYTNGNFKALGEAYYQGTRPVQLRGVSPDGR